MRDDLWLPARTTELLEHFNWRGPNGETLSKTEIGVKMGVSKGTIAGKLDRLELPPRPVANQREQSVRALTLAHMVANAVDGVWTGQLKDLCAAIECSRKSVPNEILLLIEQGRVQRIQQGNAWLESSYLIIDPTPIKRYDPAEDSGWTSEDVELLRKDRDAGLSRQEMAKRRGKTRHAIVGKIDRLIATGTFKKIPTDREPVISVRRYLVPKIPRPTSKPKQRRVLASVTFRPIQKPPAPAPKPVAARASVAMVSMSARPIFIDFRSAAPPRLPPPRLVADDGTQVFGPALRGCMWPVVDGSVTVPWVFCGVPRSDEGPYCHAHYRLAHHRGSVAA